MDLERTAQEINTGFAGQEVERLLASPSNPWMNLPPADFDARIRSAIMLSAGVQRKWLKLSLSIGEDIMIYPGVSGEIELIKKPPLLEIPFSDKLIYLSFGKAGCLRVRLGLFGRFYLSDRNNVLPVRSFWRWGEQEKDISCSWIHRNSPKDPV